ncbi:hypothetical protein [Staphylococcus durrellii]|uniref:hypothetical protein n=1 Tax=Staphylococcus durrellii TaxID=2781773 RepID=UPI0018A0BA53|nr:hypothetical protein [Staphylococcus durrellii]MBF7016188.1 hypothetical protein [Staphylococcus durrellii]
MTTYDDARLRIDKLYETRSQRISTMIDEGGLGADRYYDIEKYKLSQLSDDQLYDWYSHTSDIELIELLEELIKEDTKSTNYHLIRPLKLVMLERMN